MGANENYNNYIIFSIVSVQLPKATVTGAGIHGALSV